MMHITIMKMSGSQVMLRNDTTNHITYKNNTTVSKEATQLKKEGWVLYNKVTPTTYWVMCKEADS